MTTVDVFLGEEATYVGQAHFTRTRGQVATTFLYAPGYLASDGFSFDPALPLVAGAQYQEGMVQIPSPMRWRHCWTLRKNAVWMLPPPMNESRAWPQR